MKKVYDGIVLMILASPLVAQAQSTGWRPAKRFAISGTEMSHVGMVAAVMIAIGGYILLRRRYAPNR